MTDKRDWGKQPPGDMAEAKVLEWIEEEMPRSHPEASETLRWLKEAIESGELDGVGDAGI